MEKKIGLDKFCDLLSKINMDFTDFILEDWESEEEGMDEFIFTIFKRKKLKIKS